MRRWLAGLILAVFVVAMTGVVAASNRSQAPAIHADSSAVVVLVDNRTPVPVEVFIKLALTYHRLGMCGPGRCLYVVPSVQLGATDTFQVSGLAHGETEPDDSPMLRRVPGRPSVMQYTVDTAAAAAPERA